MNARVNLAEALQAMHDMAMRLALLDVPDQSTPTDPTDDEGDR